MTANTIEFRVTRLDTQVPEGVPFECRAQVDFHVRLSFPDLALSDIGVDPELAQPIRATLHPEGKSSLTTVSH